MKNFVTFLLSQRLDKKLTPLYSHLYLILIFITLLSIVFYSGFLQFYDFDEFVVSTISKQPLSQLFDTIYSEPHPPGFYLLLKFFGFFFHTPASLKRSVISFCLIMFAFIMRYGTQLKIFRENKMYFGTLLFLSSYGFTFVSNNLKQDIVTFPLIILVFFICLNFFDKLRHHKSLSLSNYTLLVVLNLLIFFFGYLAFAWSFFITSILLFFDFYQTKKVKSLLPLGVVLLIVLLYFGVFGYEQFLTNRTRFLWINYQNNSFIPSLSTFLIGAEPHHFLTDMYLIGSFVLLYLSIEAWRQKKLNSVLFFLFSVVTVLAFAFGYELKIISQTRYMLFPFFVLCLLLGWSAEFFQKKVFLVFIIFLMVSIKTTVFIRSQSLGYSTFAGFITSWSPFFQDKKVGFLSSAPTGSYFFYLQFTPQEKNLIPINSRELYAYEGRTIEKKHLLNDGKLFSLSNEETIQRLRDLHIEHFMFVDMSRLNFLDKDDTVLRTLQQHCVTEHIDSFTRQDSVYFFASCDFTKNL